MNPTPDNPRQMVDDAIGDLSVMARLMVTLSTGSGGAHMVDADYLDWFAKQIRVAVDQISQAYGAAQWKGEG